MSELFGPNFAEYIPKNKIDRENVSIKRGLIPVLDDSFLPSTHKLVSLI